MSAAATVAALLPVAAPVRADTLASDFLATVSADGLNVGDTPADVQITLATGTEICNLMHDGYSPHIASRQVKYFFPGATPEQAMEFVDAAQKTLCPQMFTPVEPGGY